MHKGLSGTVCRRTLREDGVSEAMGAMLLITIIAMGISIFVVGVMLQPVDSVPPTFTFNVSYGPEGEVYIRHLGGEAVSKDLLHVYIADGEAGETAEDVQYLLEINDSTAWNTWHIGETLVYSNPSRTERPEVAMTYADQSGAQYLYYASYNWTGAIPAATPEVPPTANFTASPTSGSAPLTVRFTDTSTGRPTQWPWEFGDGGTSNDRNPAHTHAAPGTYTVSLTASNSFGSDIETKTDYITVNVPPVPVADFTGAPLSGAASLIAQFTDTSTNVPTSWAWDFGDSGTSTLQNPSHTYAAAGTYTVTLTATNAGGSGTATRENYITVTEPQQSPTAAFSANVTTGTAPLAVAFTDTSTGGPTSWSWNFGDGATSAEQNPVHTYESPGNYTVTLTATNAAGSDTETKMGYITVATAPTVTAISPDSMNRGNTVWPTITGTGFMSGATVKLTKAEESDIIATNIVVNSPTSINCKIELPPQGKPVD